MIVVDTNVIGYLYLTGDRSGQSEAALRRDSAWAAPLLWRSELANVLASYLRSKRLSLADAQGIMSKALDRMNGREFAVGPLHALALAEASGCSAYDCEFVALAQDLAVPLITVDQELIAGFPETAVSLEGFARKTI